MEQLTAEEWEAIALSVRVALVATLFTLPVAIGLGWLLARRNFIGKSLLQAFVTLPLVMPPVVTGYLLLLAFGKRGPLGILLHDTFGITLSFRWTGAALAAAVMSLPLMVQAIRIAISAVDMRLEAAARTLGANRVWVFCTITLPLALPGVLAACLLGFAKALGEFGATITFVSAIPGQTLTIASAIHSSLQEPGGEPVAWRLTAIAIAISVLAVLASEILARALARRLGAGR